MTLFMFKSLDIRIHQTRSFFSVVLDKCTRLTFCRYLLVRSSGTSGQDWNGERSGGEAGNVQPTIDASWEICIAPVEKEDGLATSV